MDMTSQQSYQELFEPPTPALHVEEDEIGIKKSTEVRKFKDLKTSLKM